MTTYDLIRDEVTRAREKFPRNTHLFAALTEEVGEVAEIVTTLAFVSSMSEHLGEVARALQDENRDKLREEAVQVAAMAVRIIEEGTAEYPASE